MGWVVTWGETDFLLNLHAPALNYDPKTTPRPTWITGWRESKSPYKDLFRAQHSN